MEEYLLRSYNWVDVNKVNMNTGEGHFFEMLRNFFIQVKLLVFTCERNHLQLLCQRTDMEASKVLPNVSMSFSLQICQLQHRKHCHLLQTLHIKPIILPLQCLPRSSEWVLNQAPIVEVLHHLIPNPLDMSEHSAEQSEEVWQPPIFSFLNQ